MGHAPTDRRLQAHRPTVCIHPTACAHHAVASVHATANIHLTGCAHRLTASDHLAECPRHRKDHRPGERLPPSLRLEADCFAHATAAMSRILIAGCGYVGSALAVRLAQNGDDVWGMRLDAGPLLSGVQALQADLTDPETLSRLPTGLDYVFYTAGASEFSEAAYEAAYVLGMSNLLTALQSQAQQPKRIIFTSSTGVYAQQEGQWVDEESPTEPTSFSGKAVLKGEGLLQASPFESITLRLGGIYGPGRTRLIDHVRKGEASLEARPRYLNLIPLEDSIGALTHRMPLESAEALYLGVDSEPQEWNEFIRWIARQLGLPEPSSSTEAPSRRPPRNRRCSNARLRATGYSFRYPSSRDGYRELIESGS